LCPPESHGILAILSEGFKPLHGAAVLNPVSPLQAALSFVLAEGFPLDDRQLPQKALRPVAEELGIYSHGFGWHTFRRMHLTLVQEAGATTFEAMAQACHSRPSMTREYTIIGLDRRERAVRQMQGRLFVVGKEPDRIAGQMREERVCGNGTCQRL
jgi:hypothetical protein